MTKKLATPPKPYTPKELSTEELVPMIGNEGKTYVKFPIRNSVYTRITKKLGLKPRPSRTALISFITVKIY